MIWVWIAPLVAVLFLIATWLAAMWLDRKPKCPHPERFRKKYQVPDGAVYAGQGDYHYHYFCDLCGADAVCADKPPCK